MCFTAWEMESSLVTSSWTEERVVFVEPSEMRVATASIPFWAEREPIMMW